MRESCERESCVRELCERAVRERAVRRYIHVDQTCVIGDHRVVPCLFGFSFGQFVCICFGVIPVVNK